MWCAYRVGYKDDGENFLRFDYNFATSQNGWTGDFADYPMGEEVFYELSFSHDTLPVYERDQSILKNMSVEPLVETNFRAIRPEQIQGLFVKIIAKSRRMFSCH